MLFGETKNLYRYVCMALDKQTRRFFPALHILFTYRHRILLFLGFIVFFGLYYKSE